MPRCDGSQGRQRGEPPELRGNVAGQVVAVKAPARGAPEREIMGERRRTQRAASATRALPYAPPPSAPSHPLSCHAWRRGCRGGVVAHSSVSAVSSPSCVGTLPLRSMTIKYLREVLRSGIVGNGNGRRGRQVRRACFPYARPPSMPSKPLPCHGLEARGCRGAVAYRRSSTVSSPSCEGRLPVMSL